MSADEIAHFLLDLDERRPVTSSDVERLSALASDFRLARVLAAGVYALERAHSPCLEGFYCRRCEWLSAMSFVAERTMGEHLFGSRK